MSFIKMEICLMKVIKFAYLIVYFILEGKIQLVNHENYVYRFVDEGRYFGAKELLQKAVILLNKLDYLGI